MRLNPPCTLEKQPGRGCFRSGRFLSGYAKIINQIAKAMDWKDLPAFEDLLVQRLTGS